MINLKQVVEKYPECLDNKIKLKAILTDLYPTEKARIRVIIDSFECGVYEKLKSAKVVDKLLIDNLCAILENDYAISNKFAEWCVNEWCIALDKGNEKAQNIKNTNINIETHTIIEKNTIAKTKEENNDTDLSNIKVGDIIKFGSYPQGANGEIKPIEWQVLSVKNNKALLISKYALDYKPFNEEYVNVTWKTCTLRKWLNDDFYNKAFGEEDKQKIVLSNVTADKNPKYSTNQGNNTTDKVFLLSIKEAEQYFNSDNKRATKGTDYCYKRGAYKNSNGNCVWWLRSSGYGSDAASYVFIDGYVITGGYNVNYVNYAVRQALRIKVKNN